jgi:hypothetical protein
MLRATSRILTPIEGTILKMLRGADFWLARYITAGHHERFRPRLRAGQQGTYSRRELRLSQPSASCSARTFDWNAVTNYSDDNRTGPFMKKNLLFTLSNAVDYHWYSAVENSQYSFQQFVFNGDETIQLGSNVRRVVYARDVRGCAERQGSTICSARPVGRLTVWEVIGSNPA